MNMVEQERPALPLEQWEATYRTLHMWTQIVGKVRLVLTPLENHWWNTALYVNTRGLTTSPIPYRGGAFEIQFDFVHHRLELRKSVETSGGEYALALSPKSVAAFYRELLSLLREAGIDVHLNPNPEGIPKPCPLVSAGPQSAFDPHESHP